MSCRLTVITATCPPALSKRATRTADGQVACTGGGVLVEGHARVVDVTSLSGFGALLEGLGPDQALTFGVPSGGDGPVLSRQLFARHPRPANATTRTRDRFGWPDGPGILMLDHDPGEDPLSRDALVDLLRSAAPGLATAEMLWWPSASSHVCDAVTGEELTGLRGQRLYLMVRDAADIPRAGAALVTRLWAAGHGRIEASKAGKALERCPVDACVWQPERLDFAAGALCDQGLVQQRGSPVPIDGEMSIVDSRAALPDDHETDLAAQEARRRARCAASDMLGAAREHYVARRAEEILGADDGADEEKGTAARAVIRRATEHGVLCGPFPVEVERTPGAFETVTVAQILADRTAFHGRLTRDPLEPGYDGGRTTGKLFLHDARPMLFSFAHGGQSFRLTPAPHRVEIVRGRTADATEATVSILRDDPAIFEFGDQVALVEDGRVRPLDEHALSHYLGGHVQFWRLRLRSDDAQPEDVDPPAKLVRQILSLGARRRLKPLAAVVTAPTLRPDGSVIATAGHDAETGLFLHIDDCDVMPIPETPDRQAVARALEVLMEPFREFPLVDAYAWGALLSALLTAVVRSALPTAPAFAIDAPVQGSGKTLLASCIAALATGSPPEIWPHTAGRDDEEVRKRLFTALRDGATALVWDNVTGVLNSAALAAAITAPVLCDRVLGRSESLGIPNRALLLLTGNNLCPAGDLSRRLVTARIDPLTDSPFCREFDLDPLACVLEHRNALVVAALTLIRGRLSSGTRRAPGRTASFEAWDDLVRQTVCWVGAEIAPDSYGDPLELIQRAQRGDPEQESLFALLEAIAEVFPGMWFTAKDVSQRAQRGRADHIATAQESTLAEAMSDLAGDRTLSTRSIGRLLKFREGRVVFGLRLVSRMVRNRHEFRVETANGPDECGFGRFDRFDSGGSETRLEGGQTVLQVADPNRPNRPNPHLAEPVHADDWE